MASKPGILTDWPWKSLGSFKYVILAPWVVHSIYTLIIKDGKERDPVYVLFFPFLLWRTLHNQIWISLARYRTAKGNNRIVDKSIEFEQVDRESNWDDQILLNGILFYVVYMILPGVAHMPLWRTDGVLLTILLHMGPVEFLYYWLHRALHHHYLYSRYHSHHHSSIVTEPITSVIHPFAEHLAYFLLFLIPLLAGFFMRKSSMAALFGYISYIDFMNNMGHCNFELIPKMLFSIFPPLKYLMYTPSYHSLHHTQFRTNYSLFMPIYDYIYGTMDRSSDALYEKSLIRPEELPHVVHLTHLVTPQSIYHLRLGFASLASKPYTYKWYVWAMWPVTCCSIMLTWTYGRTFILERNQFNKVNVQTWVVPKFKIQGDEFNSYGELYIHNNPKLKIKVVDGSSLAVAVVLNSIPKGTTQVLFRGNLSKVAYFIASALCQMDIQVATSRKDEYEQLNTRLKNVECEIWVVGDGLTKEEQMKASTGTLFIPFSQFPPKRLRKDCLYHTTPAMMPPKSFQNIDSCENWLPRRAMSASRVAGVIHALEGWNVHECGNTMFNVEKIWEASLQHGFRPLTVPT
ncbi:Protein ECERIFERUM 1 [Vitis vinifera]|uniref:Protein ECERIFERUM 1 n=1 Tax=Vitis vinifera TaxID=29760 RepID=A0A438CC91_VITVI|nr:Protein ECERIFERUM 1 [Vitis vinifera]